LQSKLIGFDHYYGTNTMSRAKILEADTLASVAGVSACDVSFLSLDMCILAIPTVVAVPMSFALIQM
jgi:hypothetical protein